MNLKRLRRKLSNRRSSTSVDVVEGNAGIYQVPSAEPRGAGLRGGLRSLPKVLKPAVGSVPTPDPGTARGRLSMAASAAARMAGLTSTSAPSSSGSTLQSPSLPGSVTRSLPPNPKRLAAAGKSPGKGAETILTIASSPGKLMSTGKTSYLVDSDVTNQPINLINFSQFNLMSENFLARRRTAGLANEGNQPEVLILPTEQSLSYLDGSLPGDYGFDPLGLFGPDSDAGLLTHSWLQYAEVLHSRWAMVGVVGCLLPEYLDWASDGKIDKQVVWFYAGRQSLNVVDPASPGHAQFVAIAGLFVLGEALRLKEYVKPGAGTLNLTSTLSLQYKAPNSTPPYPGGQLFNFLDFVVTPKGLHLFKWKEIKHGRIAMLAMVGFAVQALVTGLGPWQSLLLHLQDPVANNVFAYLDTNL